MPRSPPALMLCAPLLCAPLAVALGAGCASQDTRDDDTPTPPRAGGAGGGESGGTVVGGESFPKKEALDAIGAAPAPALPAEQRVDVQRWELAGPLPDQGGNIRRTPAERIEQWLQEAITDDNVHMTEGLHCAARELARIKLRQGAYAAPRLQRFVAARCGVTATQLSMHGISGEVPTDKTVEQIYEAWGDGMRKLIASEQLAGEIDVAIALVRDEGKAAVLLVRGRRVLDVAPFSLRPDARGVVVVEGIMKEAEPGVITPWVNRGRYGAALCDLDDTIALPRFRVLCKPDPNDELASMVVSFHPRGRLFGRSLLNLTLLPSGAPAKTFVQERYDVQPATTNEAMLAELNRVRADAGLKPMRLSVGQSAAAQKLAPHFIGSMLSASTSMRHAEEIYLGLLAGWDLDETIQDANLTWSMSYRGGDLSELMVNALELPQGRHTLLNPDADVLAVARTTPSEGGVSAALFTSYAVFEGLEVKSATREVVDHYQALRADAGLKPAPMLDLDPQALSKMSQAILDGQDPDGQLRALLQLAAKKVGKVKGWLFESTSLTRLNFPEDMMRPVASRTAFVVAYRKPADSQWGRYVILVVHEDQGDLKTAGLLTATARAAR